MYIRLKQIAYALLFREYFSLSLPFDIAVWRIGRHVSRHRASRDAETDVSDLIPISSSQHENFAVTSAQ
jgi:hypothetical protein